MSGSCYSPAVYQSMVDEQQEGQGRLCDQIDLLEEKLKKLRAKNRILRKQLNYYKKGPVRAENETGFIE